MMRMRRRMTTLLAGVLAFGLTLAGCAPAHEAIRMPPQGAIPDYQLGSAYPPADGVGIVVRDRTAAVPHGVYAVCYVNGFQTQPGERADWPEDLLLHRDGAAVTDPNWPDEVLLDTSTAAHRERIESVIGQWIEGCAEAGFDAVELDNLDSYTRSGGELSLEDNLALAQALVARGHALGLAVAQKNAAEHSAVLHGRAGFDFVIAEECAAYDECQVYAEVYGERVIDVEYTDNLPQPFAQLCRAPHTPASVVLRDRRLAAPGEPGHVFQTCSD